MRVRYSRGSEQSPAQQQEVLDIEIPEIAIHLNDDSFDLLDSRNVAERPRSESDLRIESDVVAYGYIEGGLIPPDVAINLLYSLVPLADIYANMLASALYDILKAAASRQGRAHSEATFYVASVDEEGRVLREVSGRTGDREIIKDLIQQVGENATRSSDDT